MSTNTPSAATGRIRPSSLGGFTLALVSLLLSIVSYGFLEDAVRIRWTVGTYHHYGPDHVSTLFVLVMFPVLVVALYLCAWWGKRHVERHGYVDDLDDFRTVYDICLLITLGTVVAIQLIIIVLNL